MASDQRATTSPAPESEAQTGISVHQSDLTSEQFPALLVGGAQGGSWQLPGGGGVDAGVAESVCCASLNGGVLARSRSIANTKAH